MRRILFFAWLLTGCSQPVSVAGKYVGTLDEQTMKPVLTLNIEQKGAELSGSGSETFKETHQTAKFDFKGRVTGKRLVLDVPKMGGVHVILEGDLQDAEFAGTAEIKNLDDAPVMPGTTLRTRPFKLKRQ